MKKILSLLLLFAVTLGLAGCGDPPPTATTKDPLSYNLPYPYIDPTDYCQIDLDWDHLSVVLDKDLQITDADVDEYIHRLQSQYIPDQITKTEVKDRPIGENDLVYLYYYGTVDGQLFYESTNWHSDTPYRLYVGGNALLLDVGVDGFDSGLVGLVPSDTYSQLATEGTVKEGDVVFISGSVVYRDGENAESETIPSTRVDLKNIPASYGQGLADGLIGASISQTCNVSVVEDFDGDGLNETKDYYLYIEKAGPEKTVTLTAQFPKLYPENPDLAGKTASFEVVISHIEDLAYPELTTSFILEYCNYVPLTGDPVSEYRAYLKKNIEQTYLSMRNQMIEGKLLDLFCENMENVIYPGDTLVYCFEYYLAEIQVLMEEEKKNYQEGKCPFETFEQFVLLYYDDPALEGKTTDDVDEWILDKCYRNVKENLAVFYIGRALGYTITTSEISDYAAQIANQLNQEQATAKYTMESILRDMGEDYLACNLMYAKVMDYLLARVEVTFA